MSKERSTPLTNVAYHIQAAFPRHATKEIARRLNIGERQARRIVENGQAPGALQTALVSLLRSALDMQVRAAKALQDDIAAKDYAKMVGRAAARRAALGDRANRSRDQEADGQGSTLPLPLTPQARTERAR